MAETTSYSTRAANEGYSLDASDAMKHLGWDHMNIEAWKRREKITESSRIKLVRLSHMRYMHTDISAITQFLTDFGMSIVKRTDTKIWWRGTSADPYVYVVEKGSEKKFLGGAWLVESYDDLEKARNLPDATQIEEINGAPGGGYRISFTDAEGFPMDLIYGQEPGETGEIPWKLRYNSESEKVREGAFQRFYDGPAAVHKLGHYGLCVTDLQKQILFYTRNFNIVPSDFMFVPTAEDSSGRKEVAFFGHIDKGDDFVDHHSFFMSSNSTSHVHHCSFEVHDFDAQLLGHKWLAKKNYKSVWGVGRHILGSQIFDYWWDTTGFMVEHYTDGDTVNDKTPIGFGPAGSESLAIWGPDLPQDFLD